MAVDERLIALDLQWWLTHLGYAYAVVALAATGSEAI